MSYPFLYQQQQQQQQQPQQSQPHHHHQIGRINQNYGLACSATNHNLTSSNPVIYKQHNQQQPNQTYQQHHSALKNFNSNSSNNNNNNNNNSNNNVYSNIKVKQISSTHPPPIIPPSVLSKLANNYLPSGFKELNFNSNNIGSTSKKSTQ